MDVICGYCFDRIGADDFLECEECEQYVHVHCLRRPGTPGDFVGDVFFKFTCLSCTPDNREVFERIKLPWTMMIVLAMYNLSKKSQGTSRRGYFHWRSHIASFIDRNWGNLMDPAVKKRKNWIGTISGTLSHNSQSLFISGMESFNEAGWWKLRYKKNPKQYYEYIQWIRREKGAAEQKVPPTDTIPEPESQEWWYSDSGDEGTSSQAMDIDVQKELDSCSRALPFMGKRQWEQKVKEEEPIDILDFMDSSENTSFFDDMPLLPTLTSQDVQSIIPSFSTSNDNDFLVENCFDSNSKFDSFPDNIFETSPYEPRIVQVTNYQEPNSSIGQAIIKKEAQNDTENDYGIQKDMEMEDIPYEIKYKCEKSLFKKSQPSDKYPWELDFAADQHNDDDFTGDKSIELMSEYEENEIYKRLKAIFEASQHQQIDIPHWIRRHYRKLCVRRTQRSLGLPVFNVDKFSKVEKNQNIDQTSITVIDRFHHLISSSGNVSGFFSLKPNETFMARFMAGSCEYDLFVSPHTERILHPFIYRDDNCVPPWVQMMCELKYEVNGKMPSRASVDFCYVRPQHLAAVNALLQKLFWPGIDMSECLSYPDFSVVALYKKLVIGCAFLVPDVGHNEAYVSFMAVRPGWQRAGIATFMLYHLTQTCIGKDITLHVSATNPAICLYQKFGFKIQELILDFYDKYLPYDSSQSRHAFLLRLER